MSNDNQRNPPQAEYQSIYSSLRSIIRRAPVTVGIDASVRQGLEAMEQNGVGSVIVLDRDSAVPRGVFTLPDLLRRVALRDNDLERPIAEVMTRDLVTALADTAAYQAAATMARNGIRHIVVVDDQGRLVGVVSQNDLFALHRAGVKEIGAEIRSAHDIAVLRESAQQIRRLAGALLSQGVGAEALTHIVSTLNDLLTGRVIELTRERFDLPDVNWCWIALGSEGRLEQTLSTDQDNGLIFENPAGVDSAALRARFLPFARAVNEALDECGFPLCRGEIMAGNPKWCLSLEEWQNRFQAWIREAEAEALLNAAIFFDFRPLHGDQQLAARLRAGLGKSTRGARLFLRQMASNALECQPPLGIIRDFVYDDTRKYGHTIDLKMYGSRPFVDAARIFALANGVTETGTSQRLRAVAKKLSFGSDDVDAVVDGFHFILLLRLRCQLRLGDDAALANRVDPDELNELDRYILKEAFRQARKLQSRLQLDYRL